MNKRCNDCLEANLELSGFPGSYLRCKEYLDRLTPLPLNIALFKYEGETYWLKHQEWNYYRILTHNKEVIR